MITEQDILNAIEKFSTFVREKSFAEFIADLYKDKIVEIYLGDSYEEVSTEQTSMAYPAVFTGRVVGAYKECLVLDSIYDDLSERTHKFGKFIIINERSIRVLSEVSGKGVLEHNFVRSKASLNMLKINK